MLLYNHRKEFIGIDEDDLSSLDFQNISQLQDESHDFADLFVKKPGYIHNFKNFSWIDFILHSETHESKAIIHAKGINYSCILHISTFSFTNNEGGYTISIQNLTALKGAEDIQASKDLEAAGGIQSTPAPISMETNTLEESSGLDISLDSLQMDEEKEEVSIPDTSTELPSFEESNQQELIEPDPLDIPEPLESDLLPPLDNEATSIDLGLMTPTENEFGAPSRIDFNAPLNIEEDLSHDDFADPLLNNEQNSNFGIEETVPSNKDENPMLGDYVNPSIIPEPASIEGSQYLSELVSSGTYQYDPNIAADELGLPVDLIEEFIGDFIEQAYEFKDDLYASINASDFDNVQVLSHKLKGVAANLRVEDAFDVLSVVNTSKDIEEITPNINQFYKIITKLEGKEVVEEFTATPQVEEPSSQVEQMEINIPKEDVPSVPEEDYDFGIKQPDDGPMLIDQEVNVQALNDDLYDDLLIPQDMPDTEEVPIEELSSPANDDNDIYDDLLAPLDIANTEETSLEELSLPINDENNIYDDLLIPQDVPSTEDSPLEEFASATNTEEDIYDDLLGAPESELTNIESSIPEETVPLEDELYDDLLGNPHNEEPEETPTKIEVAPLNFDPQSSANQLGIPLEIVEEFVQDFKEQINTHQLDFQNALEAQDIKEINQTATLLKGMSDNLRLTEISEVLKELQSETDINNTADAIAKVQAYADQL